MKNNKLVYLILTQAKAHKTKIDKTKQIDTSLVGYDVRPDLQFLL